MIRNEVLDRLFRSADRRSFLKACGVLGVGVAAGGVLQSVFKVIDVGGDEPLLSRMRPAMGTFVEVSAADDSRDRADEAIELAFAEMDRLVAILSRHDSSTPLSHLNATGSLSSPPEELTAVVLGALDVHRRTGGAFDPTVKPLIDLLEASADNGLPSRVEIREALSRVGAGGVEFADRRIRLAREGMGITLDGLAKGYIVDRMSDVLSENGVESHLVNAGGDIRTRGARAEGRAWTIAIEDPKKQGNYPDVIRMGDGAVATSGNYEHFYNDDKTVYHIVDPATGTSPQRCVSASVRAGTVMEADALSTSIMVSQALEARWASSAAPGADYLVVRSDGRQERSTGWVGVEGTRGS